VLLSYLYSPNSPLHLDSIKSHLAVQDQDQDQDNFLVLEVPRDQDQSLEDYSTGFRHYKSHSLHTVIRIHLISLSYFILVFAISFYLCGAHVNVNCIAVVVLLLQWVHLAYSVYLNLKTRTLFLTSIYRTACTPRCLTVPLFGALVTSWNEIVLITFNKAFSHELLIRPRRQFQVGQGARASVAYYLRQECTCIQ